MKSLKIDEETLKDIQSCLKHEYLTEDINAILEVVNYLKVVCSKNEPTDKINHMTEKLEKAGQDLFAIKWSLGWLEVAANRILNEDEEQEGGSHE